LKAKIIALVFSAVLCLSLLLPPLLTNQKAGAVTSTSLTLNVSTLTPVQGQQMTFSGYLKQNDTGAGVTGATISIYDDDPLFGDDLMASGTTGSNGYFSISWTAAPMDTDNRGVEAYAKFAGTSTLGSSETGYYQLIIGATATPTPTHTPIPTPTRTSTPTPTTIGKVSTSLNLSVSKYTPVEGEQITFSGYLKRADTGAGVTGVTISIYDSDPLFGDDLMASGTTGSNGYFSIQWTAAPMDTDNRGVESYALFAGTSTLGSKQSAECKLDIGAKVGTSLTLNVSKLTPVEGEQITFSGYLKRDDTGAGVTGVTISIKDSDPLFGDDQMASGTTGSNGYFSIQWTAAPMDPDNRGVEAYAAFAGTSTLGSSETGYYQLTIGATAANPTPTYTPTSTRTRTPTPSPTPNDQWRKNIRSGDIAFDPTGAHYLGHIGIFWRDPDDGAYYVIEALGSGVSQTPIEDWDLGGKAHRGGAYALRVNCTDDVAAAAANLALTELGTPYTFAYIMKDENMGSPYRYCSELVWAAYYNVGIDIEYTPDNGGVSPMEIYLSPRTQVIGHHGKEVGDCPISLSTGFGLMCSLAGWSMVVTCPVDLAVTDPDGLTISRSSSEIDSAVYIVDDFNNDGALDTWVYIPEAKNGTYNTTVIAQAEAQPDDTYTLKNYQSTGITTIAENVSIADITSEPYSVEYHADTSGLGAGAWAGIAIGIVIALIIVGYFLLGMIFGWKTQDTGKK